MKRWLVTGAGGMLARDLVALIPGEVIAADRSTLDITRVTARDVSDVDIVVNCAAWTDVDGAEAQPEAANEVNGRAVSLLAQACATSGARLIQLSTDYVFPGTSSTPYTEDAPTEPVNAYGRSKLLGESAAPYVVRTAWLYGAHGRNFVATILRLARSQEAVNVVDDQVGQPTWTVCLARQIVALGLAEDAPPGVYHGTASGSTTWFGLARAAFELAGLDPARVKPVGSEAFPRPAPRPAYSVLAHDRWKLAGVAQQPHWHDQLRAAFVAGVF